MMFCGPTFRTDSRWSTKKEKLLVEVPQWTYYFCHVLGVTNHQIILAISINCLHC